MKDIKTRKAFSIAILMGALVLSISVTHASEGCGAGKVTAIKEGGWNKNHFMFKLDNSISPPLVIYKNTFFNGTTQGTTNNGWIRIRDDTITAKALKAYRSLVYLAFARNLGISVGSSFQTCSNASGIDTVLTKKDD